MSQNRKPNRREFIKKSSTLASSAAFVGFSTSSVTGYAADNNILKLGIIGCGGRGSGAARQALLADDNLELVAMADVFDNRLQLSYRALQKSEVGDRVKVNKDRQYVGLDAFNKLLASDVDVVILATPPGFRPQYIAAAIDAGKHVFAEKPGATDVPGALSILDSAKKAKEKGLFLVAGLQGRYEADQIEMVARLHRGDIGEINSMRMFRYLGPVKSFARTEEMTDLEYQITNWQYFTWLSGDGMVELFIHEIDRMAWIAGEYPESCLATGGRQTRIEEKYGHVFDHFAACYKFPSGLELYASTRQQKGCDRLFEMVVHGSKGRCLGKGKIDFTIEADKPWKSLEPKEGGSRRRRKVRSQQGHQLEHDAMYAALRSGGYINNGDYLAKSTLMAIMARESAYSGKKITWEALIKNPQRLVPTEFSWDMKLPKWKVAMPGLHGIM